MAISNPYENECARMNATELKTFRQSLWLTRETAARMFNVQDRVYRYWESGDWPIPADVEAVLRNIDRTLADMVDHAGDTYADLLQRHGAPSNIVLIRYDSDDDLWRYHPQMTQLTHTLHAAGVDRARQRLERVARVRIVTMDRQAYEDWRAALRLRDGSDTCAAWAATVTDPPTRAKKTGKASGEDLAT